LGERIRVLAIMGPTAVGKTELAAELAREFDGEIVSVDSAQVYVGMDIGTAKPGLELRAEIPHHLIDIRDPALAYSAAEFADDAREAVTEIAGRGRLPILAGGTMLYFRALLEGLSPMPSADPALRAELDRLQAEEGSPGLHRRLAAVDPGSARRLHPNDPQRIKRALEVFRLTGRPLAELQAGGGEAPDWRVFRLALAPPQRERLHRRIAERFHGMLERGFLDEVRCLYERGDLDDSLPSVRSVGYRQAWRHLEGRLDHGEMVARGIAATRQLAKRQCTWLRRETEAHVLNWNDDSDLACIRREIRAFLN